MAGILLGQKVEEPYSSSDLCCQIPTNEALPISC